MEMSGYPHYEKVSSNILAFFLDPSSPHGLGSLCLDALLEVAETRGPLSNVTVEREVRTESGKWIDIVICSDSHLVAIYREVKDRGPGTHILTGPVFVNGAMPGDVHAHASVQRNSRLVMPTNSRLVWVLTKPLKIRGILRWALL
jgi:hypothetical protein